MKNFIVYIFALISFVISGCDNSTEQPQPIVNSTKEVKNNQMVKKEIKPSPKAYNGIKSVKKKSIKPKKNDKELVEPIDNKQALDLSIPDKFRHPLISSHNNNYRHKKYLPDFFAEKNKQKENRLQIKGKVIQTQEEEIEKQRGVDGVGIAFKLAD